MNSKITLFFISLFFVCIAKAEDHQLQDMDLSGYKESGTGGFVSSSRQRPPFRMALKTNMLYDALLAPNVAAEFHISRGWTAGVSYTHAWWSNSRRHRYWRFCAVELGIRRYLDQTRFSGHHFGIYGQLLSYDFRVGKYGYMGGKSRGAIFDNPSYVAALEYGYTLPVGRRINIDFSIGIGYMGGRYYKYQHLDDCDVWKNTGMRSWLGPTKAEVSLIWLIGRDNYNRTR